ncbi:ferrochelatase [Chlorobaculum limnaeum]|uniref:coproporphyrin ferrochelatase n=1 Tax=Chlorobaculum limnaeum TaxID=274537 RepID=A0A1D8D0N5_CHLLM|nr:ferrochelatase [Chlorobaculum limnaeum]AOS83971.1 ferrochelatase [Chlorobaculum limnaeum]
MVAFTVSGRRYRVVLVTYGEVEKLTVRALWPSSRKIIEVITRKIVKLPKLLIYMIADYRSAKHYLDWKLHRYRSRLVEINRQQALGVEAALRRNPRFAGDADEIEVADAYYFVPPYLEEVLDRFRGCSDGIVVVPMFPVESAFSCGPACQMVIDHFGENHLGALRVVRGLWKDEALHRLYLDHLFASLPSGWKGSESKGKQGLVLVIHGTIVKNRRGEKPSVFTGLEETMEFFRVMREKIMADPRNAFGEVKLGCLNHSRGGEWTPETVERALEEFAAEGTGSVAMFPFGYFADNSETDYEAKKMLERSSAGRKHYIPCINDSPAFAEWLASRIATEIGVLDVQREAFGGGQPGK